MARRHIVPHEVKTNRGNVGPEKFTAGLWRLPTCATDILSDLTYRCLREIFDVED